MAKVTHVLIERTAKGIAAEAYEDMAHTNEFFAEWPRRRTFVQKNWPMFVDHARQALIQLLAQPDLPETSKASIYEALCIDGVAKREPGTMH